jgi:hypothetical protein
MSRALPAHPNLDHLKKQAKDLLPDLQQQHPGSKLADALHAIAREYGFTTWPVLKAHVESLPREPASAAEPAAPANPFVGRWTANLSKSKRDPANQFRRATLEFAVSGDTVTITDVVVDASGREEQGRNTIQADGREHSSEHGHGYVLMAGWLGSHVLEAVVKKDGRQVSRVSYEISADGTTLTLSAAARAHDQYPATAQLSVFDRA